MSEEPEKTDQAALSSQEHSIQAPENEVRSKDPSTRAALIAEMRKTEIEFSGPLPPPEILSRYDQIVPGAAERIIAMAEKQAEHRQRLESTVVRGNTSAQTRGSWFAFLISMVAVCGGIWLIHEGRSASGLATIITDLATLAGVFVYTRRRQTKEREKKSSDLEKRRAAARKKKL